MGRRSTAEWRELLEAQRRSGLTAQAFCLKHGICPSTFSLHRKALGKAATVPAPSPFVRVEPGVAAAPKDPGLRAKLRLGRCEWEFGELAFADLIRLMQALA